VVSASLWPVKGMRPENGLFSDDDGDEGALADKTYPADSKVRAALRPTRS